jgi:uncharacterized membrane protein YuzA (DUF378 family)
MNFDQQNIFYWKKHLHLFCMILVLIGSINWGLIGLFNFNLVKFLFPKLLENIVYILVAVSAVYLAIQRDSYLPFLGQSVLPSYVLTEKIPTKYNLEVPVHVKPNSLVIYWASTEYSQKDTKNVNWKLAYDQFQNSGVVRADSNGLALLRLNCPKRYTVGPMNTLLYKHVHYRVAEDKIWLSKVYTVNVEKQCASFDLAPNNSSHETFLNFTVPNLPDTSIKEEPIPEPATGKKGYSGRLPVPMLDNQPEEEEFLAFSN